MKKLLSVILVFAVLAGVLIFPAGATENELKYYDKFIEQYCEGKDPFALGWDGFTYEELYTHTTDGQADWALIRAEFGMRSEVEMQTVFLNRAIALNDCAYPFNYLYGIYDVAQERFISVEAINNEASYPGLQTVLDEFGVGQRITSPQYGENLRYLDEFLSSNVMGFYVHNFGEENAVKCYDELYYHDNDGVTDWVLVKGEATFTMPCGSTYNVVGSRVFRTKGISMPFGNTYGVYSVAQNQFYALSESLVDPNTKISKSFPGLAKAVDELKLGELIGDMDGNGVLNIKDVTQMQRCLAEVISYPENDGVEAAGFTSRDSGMSVAYISDINENRHHDIGDATRVQKLIAEFEDQPYDGGISLTFAPSSPLYQSTYLSLFVYRNGSLVSGSSNTIKPELQASGDKMSVFYPLKKGMELYHDAAYRVYVADKSGHSQELTLNLTDSNELLFE